MLAQGSHGTFLFGLFKEVVPILLIALYRYEQRIRLDESGIVFELLYLQRTISLQLSLNQSLYQFSKFNGILLTLADR